MSTKRKPTSGVVIIGALSAKTRRKVERELSAKLESANGVKDVLVADGRTGDPKTLVTTINSIVGSEALVAPVFSDDEGHKLLPTGHFQVRFKESPDDQELAKFGATHGIALIRRNKWSNRQAEFAVSPNDSRFLPDIAEDLSADTAVDAAWPDMWAAFQRESA